MRLLATSAIALLAFVSASASAANTLLHCKGAREDGGKDELKIVFDQASAVADVEKTYYAPNFVSGKTAPPSPEIRTARVSTSPTTVTFEVWYNNLRAIMNKDLPKLYVGWIYTINRETLSFSGVTYDFRISIQGTCTAAAARNRNRF